MTANVDFCDLTREDAINKISIQNDYWMQQMKQIQQTLEQSGCIVQVRLSYDQDSSLSTFILKSATLEVSFS